MIGGDGRTDMFHCPCFREPLDFRLFWGVMTRNTACHSHVIGIATFNAYLKCGWCTSPWDTSVWRFSRFKSRTQDRGDWTGTKQLFMRSVWVFLGRVGFFRYHRHLHFPQLLGGAHASYVLVHRYAMWSLYGNQGSINRTSNRPFVLTIGVRPWHSQEVQRERKLSPLLFPLVAFQRMHFFNSLIKTNKNIIPHFDSTQRCWRTGYLMAL